MAKIVLLGKRLAKTVEHPMMACGHQADSELSRMGDQVFNPPIIACGQCLCIERRSFSDDFWSQFRSQEEIADDEENNEKDG